MAIFSLVLVLGGIFAFAYYRGVGTDAKPVPGAAQYVQPTAEPRASVLGSVPVPQVPSAGGAASTPTPRPVGFALNITQSKPSESSVFLSVSVQIYLRAELYNVGDFNASDVKVTARARVGKDYVAVDGKQALVVGVGSVAARSMVTKDIALTLDMSLSQGQAAQAEGIYFEVVVTSTEGKSYIPLMLCNATECSPAK